jgi:hypothetical protein
LSALIEDPMILKIALIVLAFVANLVKLGRWYGRRVEEARESATRWCCSRRLRDGSHPDTDDALARLDELARPVRRRTRLRYFV